MENSYTASAHLLRQSSVHEQGLQANPFPRCSVHIEKDRFQIGLSSDPVTARCQPSKRCQTLFRLTLMA